MKQAVKAAVTRSLTKGLHTLERRITRDAHKQGGIQKLLDRTWFDPSVRPVSLAVVNQILDEHGFTRVIAVRSGSACDGDWHSLAKPGRQVIGATFNRVLASPASGSVARITRGLLEDVQAVVVLDANPEEYLNVLRFCHEQGIDRPVVMDTSRLPWMAGHVPLFANALQSEVYLHHHFAEVFGIKDPIQVWYEIRDGARTLHKGFRLLGPNETARFSTQALGLSALTSGVFRHAAYHPAFAKIPHRRFRTVLDVISNASECQHHGLELEREQARPSGLGGAIDTQCFWLGPSSDMWLTAMRSGYLDDSGEPLEISLEGSANGETFRSKTLTIQAGERSASVSAKELFGRSWPQDVEVRVVATFHGPCDRICWTSMRQDSGRIQLMGNHGFQAPKSLESYLHPESPSSSAPDTASKKILHELAALRSSEILFRPFALPVFLPSEGLKTAFNVTNSIPFRRHWEIASFDRGGALVDRQVIELRLDQPTFLETAAFVPETIADNGGLLLLAPHYEREGLGPDRGRIIGYLRVQNTKSGDSDYTELQDSWRNIPGYFPTHPSNVFSGRPRSMKNRTNLMIRAVHDGDRVSSLCLILASGDLRFVLRDAPVEFRYYRPDGRSLTRTLSVTSWTVRLIRLTDLFPELPDFSPDGFGWIRILSDRVDLNILSVTQRASTGSVAMQHLWGQ